MTVKVLKGAPVYTTKKTCRECKAKLQATEEDLKVGCFGANYGGDTGEDKVYFQCPVCDSDIVCEDAPYSLLDRIKRKRI